MSVKRWAAKHLGKAVAWYIARCRTRLSRLKSFRKAEHDSVDVFYDVEEERVTRVVTRLERILHSSLYTAEPNDRRSLIRQWNLGASAADDNFCQCCGRRGVYGHYCGDCSQGLWGPAK